jgi:hypothetical protein
MNLETGQRHCSFLTDDHVDRLQANNSPIHVSLPVILIDTMPIIIPITLLLVALLI